ncbi:MAG: myosin heavy subunit [Candidatus Latescibacterota bacterium]
MTSLLITAVVVLVITCLVVRDQTEFKLGKLRTELLGLRSEEKRLEETRTEVEQLVRGVGEELNRADTRQRTAEQNNRELAEILDGMGIELETDAASTEAAPVQEPSDS